MLEVVSIIVTLIVAYFINHKNWKKNKKERNLYLIFSGLTSLLSLTFFFDIKLKVYIDLLESVFGSFTKVVIGI